MMVNFLLKEKTKALDGSDFMTYYKPDTLLTAPS